MQEKTLKNLQAEGDINLTLARKKWQDKFLSAKTKDILKEDIFIKVI